MLRHPSRHYIYYLFSKRTMDVVTIVQHLGELRLPVPQTADKLEQFVNHLTEVRRKMRFPAQYNPLDINDPTRKFLCRWKIAGMWERDEFVGKAADILFEPSIRRMLECLILGPLAVTDIAYMVQRRFGLQESAMNAQVVRAFMHYFWDDTALDQEEWRWFVYSWMHGFNDDFLTALNAPRSPAGAALTIAAADRGGSQSINPVSMYSAIRDQGFRMFMEHALHDKPGVSRTQGAMFALQIVTQAEEELEKRRGGSAELLEELHKIETVYDTTRVTTVRELPQIRKSLPSPAVVDVEGEPVEDDKEEEPT